jgi:hypothetical protein
VRDETVVMEADDDWTMEAQHATVLVADIIRN